MPAAPRALVGLNHAAELLWVELIRIEGALLDTAPLDVGHPYLLLRAWGLREGITLAEGVELLPAMPPLRLPELVLLQCVRRLKLALPLLLFLAVPLHSLSELLPTESAVLPALEALEREVWNVSGH